MKKTNNLKLIVHELFFNFTEQTSFPKDRKNITVIQKTFEKLYVFYLKKIIL